MILMISLLGFAVFYKIHHLGLGLDQACHIPKVPFGRDGYTRYIE